MALAGGALRSVSSWRTAAADGDARGDRNRNVAARLAPDAGQPLAPPGDPLTGAHSLEHRLVASSPGIQPVPARADGIPAGQAPVVVAAAALSRVGQSPRR